MVFRLALLQCDTPNPAVLKEYGDYLDIFIRFFNSSLPDPNAKFVIDGFDVVNRQEYPSSDTEYHAVILTEADASAYADAPWISRLISYIKSIAETKPQVKIIAICFGHQVVARAFGGECVPNNGIWELGTTDVELTEKGKEIFGVPTIRIQQLHRDHVPSLPPKFILLGSSSVTPVQVMALPCENDPSQLHILCFQGHPELLPDMVNKMIDLREKSGIMSGDIAKDGRARAAKPDDSTGAIGRAIWRVFGLN
ncbi:class I glutamine amidotransferase-like protein [Hysterangium stoloniferum]|nr:class I glutamine amidotransferase-like protein [Hysterangium stoloniferum]